VGSALSTFFFLQSSKNGHLEMSLNPLRWSFRPLFAFGALSCFLLVAYAYYLQTVQGLEPCPLCIFQRIGFIATGAVLLLGALQNPARIGRRVYGVLGALTTIAGGAVAGRHIWLRHLPPDQVPACGPGLDFMLEAFPLGKTLKTVFTGSGECAQSDGWTMLGLDMPSWALIGFIGLFALSVFAGFMARGKESGR
jgi:protein dithiol:quinone oxidoreductase